MGCASIKWSVLRAYATLRNFVSPDLALRKCMSQEPLVLLRQDLLPLKTWGGLPVALGDGKESTSPQVSTNLRAEVNLGSSLPFTGKLITKFLKSDEILSIF